MTPRSFFTAAFLALIGAGLLLAPDAVANRVRGAVLDALRPAWVATHSAIESLQGHSVDNFVISATKNGRDSDELASAIEIERERNRALQIRLAQMIERQSMIETGAAAPTNPERLLVPSLIEAAVLGNTVADQWCAGKFLNHGENNGLREHELVLSARKTRKTLIDLGDDADLSPEDALLLGRCVVGKVEHVGRWTSTVQLVTDAQYRGRAQLIRETTDGLFVFGDARGILKGQGGPLCKLEGIPAECSVHIHDEVYTAERDGILPTPLYYGQVIEANLGPDDREWTVLVKPASLPTQLTTVHVLRLSLNPHRLAVK